jgi:regulatory protein
MPDPSAVTGMYPHPRRPGRVAVELNGTAVGDLPIDLLGEAGLRVGLEVRGAALAVLLTGLRRTALLDKALDLMAVRARSTRDLTMRLRRHAAGDTDIAWVVGRLTAQGYLDDAVFARQLAESRARSQGASRRAIRDELQRKGISAETARSVIAEVAEEVELDDLAAARRAAVRRIRAMRSVDPPSRRRRLYAFLARRGYEADVITRVLAELLREDGEGDSVEA